MKLEAISVKNYRSITSTKKIQVGDLTVLVGPNNEGKSNILRALTLAMNVIRRYGIGGLASHPVRGQVARAAELRIAPADYDWVRDYPKALQERGSAGSTTVDLWFRFDPQECAELKERIGSQLNSALCMRVTVGQRRTAAIRVIMRGPGSENFNKNARTIADFVGRRLRVEYVGAIRTSRNAQNVTRELLHQELWRLSKDSDVSSALANLESALRPTIDRMAANVQATLSDFLPEVTSASLELEMDTILLGLAQQISIVVDDGVRTELEHKGDGVQSLASIAMARYAAGGLGQGELFLAVEEPEAHLHPTAVHQLKQVLQQIAGRQQVVLTTHSPLLVNRASPGSNIVVRSNLAKPAANIGEVRDALGVRVSDNLRSARVVVMVEGANDTAAFSRVLSELSGGLVGPAEADGTLAYEALESASNLSARLQHLHRQICSVLAVLDDDQAGRTAAQRALSSALIESADLFYAGDSALDESEFEDMVRPDIYRDDVLDAFGIDVAGRGFAGRSKWSTRLEQAARAQGRHWDAAVKRRAKAAVSAALVREGVEGLTAQARSNLSSLARQLERLLAIE